MRRAFSTMLFRRQSLHRQKMACKTVVAAVALAFAILALPQHAVMHALDGGGHDCIACALSGSGALLPDLPKLSLFVDRGEKPFVPPLIPFVFLQEVQSFFIRAPPSPFF